MNREARAYWARQRRTYRRPGPPWAQGLPVTAALVALLLVGFILETWFPGVIGATVGAGAAGAVVRWLLATILPGGLLGLLFSAVFVGLLGSQLEGTIPDGLYVAVFFLGGAVGSVLFSWIAGGVGASFAGFALAGAYALMVGRWAGRGPALQWVAILLVLNIILTGLNPAAVAGMVGAFAAGAGIVAARDLRPRRRWP
jgi:membrane associated rhomboid family serine protease